MNELGTTKRIKVLQTLLEGNSINSTVRLTGVAKNTVLKLLVKVGKVSQDYQDKTFRNLNIKRIQADEIWSFCYSKEKNVPADKKGLKGYGSVWTWVAICPESKLVPCWHVGARTTLHAQIFMMELSSRINGQIELVTDGYRSYPEAIEKAFGNNVNYAMLVKTYGKIEGEGGQKVLTIEKKVIQGNVPSKNISTAFVERQNLTMRMGMRRFTRDTNAHSKKFENLKHAIALNYMYYNFIRVHQTLGTTPAIAAGVTKKHWKLRYLLSLI